VTAGQALSREAIIASLNAERDKVSYRLKEVHQEMMLLPIEERRIRLEEYYRRLGALMKLQDEVAQAMTTLLLDTRPPASPAPSGSNVKPIRDRGR